MEVDRLADGTPVKIAVRTYGNPAGVPVMYLHGGPGDCCFPALAKVYDKRKYFILLFDQRGCGRSTPKNCLEKNTTLDLVADIEKIRLAYFAAPMVLAGGSWGSALALVYSIKYPKNVLGLLLRAVYDLSPEKTEYAFFPELLEKKQRLAKTPQEVTRRLAGKRDATRRALVQVLTTSAPLYVFGKPRKDPFSAMETMAIIGHHYESNNFFMPPNFILDNMATLHHIPVIAVQGRFDVVTPPEIAFRLFRDHPQCDLRVVLGGHTFFEPKILKELSKASKDMYAIVQKRKEKTVL